MDIIFQASTDELPQQPTAETETQPQPHSDFFPETIPAGCTDTRQKFKTIPPHRLSIMGVSLKTYLKDHKINDAIIIRQFLEEQDMSSLDAEYSTQGRPGFSPRDMFGLILYGITKGVDSVRGLAKLACQDLGSMWVCQGIQPDYSTIAKFIIRHGSVLTLTYFESFTKAILKKTKTKGNILAGDGTTMEAASSSYRTLKSDALKEKLEKAEKKLAEDPENLFCQEKVTKYKALDQELDRRIENRKKKGKKHIDLRISPSEPEAYIQPVKRRCVSVPSYKSSVISTEGRIVTSFAIDATSETKVLFDMLKQARKITNHSPEWLLLDAGYHTSEIMLGARERKIPLITPQGRANKKSETGDKKTEKKYPKSKFVYDAQNNCYTCPEGNTLEKRYECKKATPPFEVYRTTACEGCPARAKCTTNKKGRLLKRYKHDEVADKIRAMLQEEKYKEIYRQRQAIVEPVFSNTRENQKFNRFRRVGLEKAKMELGLHMLAHNLSRLVALLFYFLCYYLAENAKFRKVRIMRSWQ